MQANDCIIVINAGSSSIKFSMYTGPGAGARLARQDRKPVQRRGAFVAQDAQGAVVGERSWPDAPLNHEGGMRFLVDFAQTHLDGHRWWRSATASCMAAWRTAGRSGWMRRWSMSWKSWCRWRHLPHNLAPVRSVLAMAPHVPQIGCFDTAFHVGQPAEAQEFALPARITDLGVRRYGFHGLSYEYIASVLPQADAALAQAKVVAAHLGNGASMCAMLAGRSMASTMGFTASTACRWAPAAVRSIRAWCCTLCRNWAWTWRRCSG
jgi:acetate kinase